MRIRLRRRTKHTNGKLPAASMYRFVMPQPGELPPPKPRPTPKAKPKPAPKAVPMAEETSDVLVRVTRLTHGDWLEISQLFSL